MNAAPPQSEGLGRRERLGIWMRARTWRLWLILILVWSMVTIGLLAAWLGVAILLRGSGIRNGAAVTLNLVLVYFVGTVGLIVLHRSLYPRFRRDRSASTADISLSRTGWPPRTSEPVAPLPRIDWPWTLRLRHALIYAVGICTLLYTFAPYGNQVSIVRFITSHSAGRSSAGSLNMVLFGYLPMAALCLLATLLTWRQMRRRDAGLLDARGKRLLDAETAWLFSFGAAFTLTAFLCRWAGSMIVAHL